MANVYLSLGSNQGDRLAFLDRAVSLVGQRLAPVQLVSPVFSSPSWGFSSTDFYNLCLKLEVDLPPELLLQGIFALETDMGRLRETKATYTDRVIDIDILLYGGMCVNTNTLQIPHPLMQYRRFVLLPLSKIAPHVVHPILNKTALQLLEACTDLSVLKQCPH